MKRPESLLTKKMPGLEKLYPQKPLNQFIFPKVMTVVIHCTEVRPDAPSFFSLYNVKEYLYFNISLSVILNILSVKISLLVLSAGLTK